MHSFNPRPASAERFLLNAAAPDCGASSATWRCAAPRISFPEINDFGWA
jgi:hypothetical protein